MEESESLSSCECSPCVTNVKKFVEDFEHHRPAFGEDASFDGSMKKRETMTKTSFKKLKELKKNLEHSMYQRYELNKDHHIEGKPISEVKEALKRSMESLSSKSFTCKPHSSEVKLRNKNYQNHLKDFSDLKKTQNSRRLSFVSGKIKPIPLPKPKTSLKDKYKSVSDLRDTKQSIVFKSLDLNNSNDVFEKLPSLGKPSRLSYDLSRVSHLSLHSANSPDFQNITSPTPIFFSDSSTDPTEYAENPLFFKNSKSCTFNYEAVTETPLKHNQQDKDKVLTFETIGESSTDDMSEDEAPVRCTGEAGSVKQPQSQESQVVALREVSWARGNKHTGTSKKEVHFSSTGDTDTETLHSISTTSIPMSTSSFYSEASEDAEAGSYYVFQADTAETPPNLPPKTSANLDSHPVEKDKHTAHPQQTFETYFSPTSPSCNFLFENISAPGAKGTQETASNFFEEEEKKKKEKEEEKEKEEKEKEEEEKKEKEEKEKEEEEKKEKEEKEENKDKEVKGNRADAGSVAGPHSKPCLKVSPLQSTQQQPSATPSPKNILSTGLLATEVFLSDCREHPTTASHIIDQPLVGHVHSFFSSVISFLSSLSNQQQEEQAMQLQALSDLLTPPLSGFERISDVLPIHYTPPPPSEKEPTPSSKVIFSCFLSDSSSVPL